jgi:hypothetical protein
MSINLLVSIIGMVFGAFVAASPRRVAKVWGAKRLDALPNEQKALFIRLYRVFGVLVFLENVLVTIDSIVFAKYR